jgi:hypothetical protein
MKREQAVFQKYVRGLPMTEDDVRLLSQMMTEATWVTRAQTEFERQRRTGGLRPNPQAAGYSTHPDRAAAAIRRETAAARFERARLKALKRPRKNPSAVPARFVVIGGKRRLVTESEARRVARSVGCARSNPQEPVNKPPRKTVKRGLKYLAYDGAEERPMTKAERDEFARLFRPPPRQRNARRKMKP